MPNPYFTAGNVPVTQSRGSSSTVRAEFAAVAAGFDKLPTLAQLWSSNGNYAVAGGSVNAWTATIASSYLTSYVDGMQVRVKFANGNTSTTPTINLNGLGAKTICRDSGLPIAVNDILDGMVATLTYNSTFGKFQLLQSLSGGGSDINASNLASSGGAALVGTVQSGAGAVARTAQDKMRELVSVTDYFANGVSGAAVDPTGVIDSTAGIQAAINYCKQPSATQTERALLWPAGVYKVTSLNFLQAERVTNIALGSVLINGSSVGGTAIISIDGGLGVNYTRRLNWQGNFTIQIGAGGSYQYGVYVRSMIDSHWDRVTVSGAYSVNSVYLDYCWNNPMLSIVASNSSGAAISTIKCGANSINRNHFNLRATGSSNMAVASACFELTGNANIVEGDFSSAQIGIKLENARGTTIISPYMETVKYGVSSTAGNSRGTVVLGGLYEVGTNGAAFDLSSTQNTTIIGPRIFGLSGGSTRTGFALGAGCYGLNVMAPDVDDTTIENAYTGTWRGHGGFADQFLGLATNWIGFPPTQNLSSDANTLDDYREYNAANTACTGAITASVEWRATRVGRKVNLVLPPTTGNATAAASFSFGVALPAEYRPAYDISFIVAIRDNAADSNTPGVLVITAATGVITVYKDVARTGNFTNAASAGLAGAVGTSVSWTV